MEFGDLELSNFRSFYGTHGFSFADREPGLYFLTGRNHAEPRLASNGAGKSSLIDGLCWALYGRTSRGLRGPQVCNWNAEKGCEAAVSIGEATVRRGWKPNYLRVEDEQGPIDLTQEELERDVLPLSYSSFLYSIVLSQFGSFFFDLTPANKMGVLADVLDIEYWTDRSKAARSRYNELREAYARAESRVDSLNETAANLRKEIAEYRKKSREFQRNREHNLHVQRQYVAQLEQKMEDLAQEVSDAEKHHNGLKEDRKKLERKFNQTRQDHSSMRERVRAIEYEVKLAQQEKDQINVTLDKLGSVTDECPYCYQKVSAEHIENEKRQAKNARSEVFSRMSEIYGRLNEARRHLRSVESQLKDMEREFLENDRVQRGALQTYTTKANELTKVSTNLEQARAELQREENAVDFYTVEWRRYRKSLSDTLWELRRKSRELDQLSGEITRAGYWVDGFKSVRLFLVEESIRFLEVETNNALTNLGLVDWRVRFDIQRETKEGAVSKGFSVMVYSPHNAEPVPWEVWAGGETQRLRLAGALALSNLVLDCKGATSNILLVDEPSAHLDADGMNDILDALQQYALASSKQIWLVDHRSLGEGGFKGGAVVTKESDGGSYIEEWER